MPGAGGCGPPPPLRSCGRSPRRPVPRPPADSEEPAQALPPAAPESPEPTGSWTLLCPLPPLPPKGRGRSGSPAPGSVRYSGAERPLGRRASSLPGAGGPRTGPPVCPAPPGSGGCAPQCARWPGAARSPPSPGGGPPAPGAGPPGSPAGPPGRSGIPPPPPAGPGAHRTSAPPPSGPGPGSPGKRPAPARRRGTVKDAPERARPCRALSLQWIPSEAPVVDQLNAADGHAGLVAVQLGAHILLQVRPHHGPLPLCFAEAVP